MKILSFVSAILGIIGFTFQMYDVFPRYQDFLLKISYVLLGLFIGTIISYFNKNQIRITSLTAIQTFAYALFSILGAAFIALVSTMIISENKDKISVVQTVLFWLAGFTLLALSVMAKGFSIDHDPTTFDEKLMLARHYKAQNNFGKSIYYFRKALQSLEEADERKTGLQSIIEALKADQIANHPNNTLST
jgi:hypothetical protein